MNKPARFDGEYLYYYFNSNGDVSLISPGLQDEDGILPFEQIHYYFIDTSDGIYGSGVGTGTTRFRNGASVTLPRAIWERITYPDNLVVEIFFTDQKGNQEVLNSKGILSVEESSTGDPYSYDYVTPNQCECDLIFQNEHAGALLQDPNSDLSNPDNEPKYFDHLFVPVEFTSIDISDSFTWGRYLKKVTLPTTIKEIKSLAYTDLQEVNFPEGLEIIGYNAFEKSPYDYTGLTEVNLPSTLKEIGRDAFSGHSIKHLRIPDSVDQIGEGAFRSNPIETLYLPNGLERINPQTFFEAEITFLSIPKSVKSIGNGAFYNSPLTYLELPYGLEEVGPNSFWGNRLSGQIILPQTIESIGEYAFNTLGWGSLTSVIVPPNISIGERAFDLGVKIIEGEYPSSIEFSSTGLDENINPGSVIAELYSSDITIGDQHQYSLIEGEGDEHNNEFTVENNQLIIVDSPDFETKSSYSIRLQTKDSGGLTFEKSFTLSVNDLNEVSTDISLSASTFDENIAGGSALATLSTTDQDAGDTFTYSLVSGTGDTDNSAFTIDGDQLKINASPDYETQESYSVRLRSTDSGGLNFEKSFTFSVNDLDENLETTTPTQDGIHSSGYISVYAFDGQFTTDLKFAIAGKNKFTDVIQDLRVEGDPSQPPTLNIELTNTSNGDAFFLHDTYSDYPESFSGAKDSLGREYIPRVQNIKSLFAGDGDDLVDLTSTETREIYGGVKRSGGGVANVYGGDGDDVILGGDGNVFGENGNDTLISHHSATMTGGNGEDIFGFIATPKMQDSVTGLISEPVHKILDFEMGVDSIKFYVSSDLESTGSMQTGNTDHITKTTDGDIEWMYFHAGATSKTMTVEMNGQSWSMDDIEFIAYTPITPEII